MTSNSSESDSTDERSSYQLFNISSSQSRMFEIVRQVSSVISCKLKRRKVLGSINKRAHSLNSTPQISIM